MIVRLDTTPDREEGDTPVTLVNDELDLWGEGSRPVLIGERIRLCRHAMGWKTIRLAEQLNMTTSAINLWEAGHRQPQEVLSDLCRVLEVSPTGLAQEAPPLPSSGPFFRSMLRRESLRLRDHATAYLRLVADLATYLERRVGLSNTGEPLIGSIEARVPEDAARDTRRHRSTPAGPVDNMIRLAESMGAVTAFGVPRQLM